MTIERIVNVFDNENGEKTTVLDFNSNNVCMQAGFSVDSGSVTVEGKMFEGDENHMLGFINLLTGDIQSVADEGIYSVLGSEMLHSITFKADEDSTVTAKYLY